MRISSWPWLGIALAGCSIGPAAPEADIEPTVFAVDPDPRGEPASGHEAPSGFSADGQRLYFTRSAADFSSALVYASDRSAEGWSAARPAVYSSGPYDAGAALTPDGNAVIFTSSRPTEDAELPDEWNLWLASLTDGEAVPLPAPVNSEHAECCAVIASDRVMYFASDREGSWDIYRATTAGEEAWQVLRLGDGVNSPHGEWPSFVGRGEGLLLFSSIRPSGLGGDDIYVALREGTHWRNARRLDEPVNSPGYEDSAILSADGRELWFSSRRSEGDLARIYRVDARALQFAPPAGTDQ